jgi:hypothetical protein
MASTNNNSPVTSDIEEVSTEEGSKFSAVAFMRDKNLEAIDSFENLNLLLSDRGFCASKITGKPTTCDCLSILSNEDFRAAVAEYQVMFAALKATEQMKIVIEWLRNARTSGGRKMFRMPFILSPLQDPLEFKDLREAAVCQHALMDILVKGKRFWYSCCRYHETNTIPKHQLTGKPSNKKRKFLEDYEEELMDHLEELKREAEPIATRYVRELTGETTLRDCQDDLLYLPPYFTV